MVNAQIDQRNLDQRLEALEQEVPPSRDVLISELQTLLGQYKQLPPSESMVKTMAWLSYELNGESAAMSDSLAKEAIYLASAISNDSLAASTFYAHRALARFYWHDFPKAQYHLDQALLSRKAYDRAYFYVYKDKLVLAMDTYDVPEIQGIHDELEALFNGPDSVQVAPFEIMLYNAKLILARFQGNGERQIAYAQKVLQLDKDQAFFTAEDRMGITADLVLSYLSIGQFTEGESLAKAAIAENEGRLDLLGIAYMVLAESYSVQGRWAEAVEAGKLAVDAGNKTGEIDMGSATFNLATNQYLANQLTDARNTLEQAKGYIPASVQFVVLDLEARIQIAAGNYEEAVRAAQAGLINLSTTFIEEDVALNPTVFDEFKDEVWAAQLLYHKALPQTKLGVETGNVTWLKTAQETNRLALALATNGYSDLQGFELTQYYTVSNKMIRKSLKLATDIELDLYRITENPTHLDAAFLAFERQKSGVLLSTIAPPQLPEVEQQRLDEAQRTLIEAQRKVALQKEDVDEQAQADVIEAGEVLSNLVQELRGRYPEQSNHFYAIPYVNASQLQQRLPAGTALISYNIYQEKPCAFLVSAKGKQVIFLPPLLEGTDLTGMIQEYTNLLRSPLLKQRNKQARLSQLSTELYSYLLAPLKSNLKDVNHLLIVGEQALFNLPFETLLTHPVNEERLVDWPYLIRDFQISYQYSATAYVLMREKEAIADHSLLAFAPVFAKSQGDNKTLRSFEFVNDTLMRSVEDGQFRPLPATREEVQEIAKLLPPESQKSLLLESSATKSALLAQLEGNRYQYLHIATHGLVNLAEARRSALACYTDQEPEDALLFLDEIQLTAVNADLVVLSSCDSGLGQSVHGEGMLALNRAFLFAGARNVVSSLWKVDDAQTKTFMLYFYQALQQGASYSAALRMAKLRMLENAGTSLPRFWSAFMLIGA